MFYVNKFKFLPCIFVVLLTAFLLPAAAAGNKEKEAGDKGEEETQAADPKVKKAIGHFGKGVEFFHEEHFSAALVEFLKSYELKPHWAVRFNIGVCYMETGDVVKAFEHLRQYLEEGGGDIPPERTSEVEGMIAKLEGKIGYLVLQCSEADATIRLDEFQEYKTPVEEPIALHAGFHTVSISKPGFKDFKKKVSVASGEKKVLDVTLLSVETGGKSEDPKIEVKPEIIKEKKLKKPKRWLWAGLGAGLALGAGAAITGGMSLKKKNDMQDTADACPSTMTRDACPDAYDYQDQARSLQIATDILWGTALAASAVGIILFIFDKPKPDKKKSTEKKEEKHSVAGIAGITIVPSASPSDRSFLGIQTTISFY